jgi:hypothetical protein
MEEIYISELVLQLWSLEFYYFLFKNMFLDFGVRFINCLSEHVIQGTVTSEIKFFSGNSYVFPKWIFIFDTDQAQIYRGEQSSKQQRVFDVFFQLNCREGGVFFKCGESVGGRV